jgi:hypothetical protein
VVDRTVADIAARNGGRYSDEIHFRHDPTASDRFVQAHVRRLEALRRSETGVERGADGSWKIAPDYLERAQQYERGRAAREPVRVDILSTLRLDEMPTHDGITWLDEDASLTERGRLGGGFGGKVTQALRQRQQWLVEQGLAEQPDMTEKLRARELQRVARQLSRELGLGYLEAAPGDPIEGIYRRPVQVGSACSTMTIMSLRTPSARRERRRRLTSRSTRSIFTRSATPRFEWTWYRTANGSPMKTAACSTIAISFSCASTRPRAGPQSSTFCSSLENRSSMSAWA